MSRAGEQEARAAAGMRAQESRVQVYQDVRQAESKPNSLPLHKVYRHARSSV